MTFNQWLYEYQQKQAKAMLEEYARQHPMTVEEAERMLEAFKESFPKVEEWNQKQEKIAAGRLRKS